MNVLLFNRVENIVTKGEIANYEHKLSATEAPETVYMWERVNILTQWKHNFDIVDNVVKSLNLLAASLPRSKYKTRGPCQPQKLIWCSGKPIQED